MTGNKTIIKMNNNDKSLKTLSDIIIYLKYARYIPSEYRRENWNEIVQRRMQMDMEKFPNITDLILDKYSYVFDKKVLPSMRSLQFAGKAIQINPARIYNCSFIAVQDVHAFSEIMFLLLSGCGVGFSVQRHHVEKLPEIKVPSESKRYMIADSIEGWSDAVKVLMKSYLEGSFFPLFDYRDIRPKGTPLKTAGGIAPGHEDLKKALESIQRILSNKKPGEKLKPIECHDIICHIALCVRSGGIRRSALISLFSPDDEEMMKCKSGEWYKDNYQRSSANNSVVLQRDEISREEFSNIMNIIVEGNSGEPGFFFTNDKNVGTNPCLHGDTLVYTKNGIFRIKDLKNKKFQVLTHTGKYADAFCYHTGQKPTREIRFSNGLTICATDEHRWPVVDSKTGNVVFRPTKALNVGDNILASIGEREINFGETGSYKEGYILGVYFVNDIFYSSMRKFVDGSIYVFRNSKLFNELTNDENNIFYKYADNVVLRRSSYIDVCEKYNYRKYNFPEVLYTASREMIRGFLQALLDYRATTSNNRIRIYLGHAIEHVYAVKCLVNFLNLLGIKAYLIESTNSYIEIRYKASFDYLKNVLQVWNDRVDYNKLEKTEFDKYHIKISSLKLNEINLDVYDIQVEDDDHTFELGTCFTSNCAEISLNSFQFCNLTEINYSIIENDKMFHELADAAAFIATLQASYTDFHYLRSEFKKVTEKESLIGVGLTGISSNRRNLNLREAAHVVKYANERYAKMIGINPAARTTTVKPSGTTSLVLGTSSGIHAWHDNFYIRRIRINKKEPIYEHFIYYFPHLIEDDYFDPDAAAYICLPIRSPEGAITRKEEKAIDLLERVKKFNVEWVKEGHRQGINYNNVSTTVNVMDHEWKEVEDWLWNNRYNYTAVSLLPFDGGTYIQMPFESIDEKRYNELISYIPDVKMDEIKEYVDNTKLIDEAACSGGKCEII